VSIITFWDSKYASIFFNSIFSGTRVNLVGSLVGQKKKIPNSFQKRQEKQTKNKKKLILFFSITLKKNNRI